MINKRILVFAPYGAWEVHHQLDAVIGAALKMRGCEVKVLACDGLFDQCFIAGKPPNPQTCRQCAQSGQHLFRMLDLPVVQLRSLLTGADMAEASEWSGSLDPQAMADATFEGSPMGDWIASSVHSYFLTVTLDFSRPEIADMFRKQLRNGALIQRAMRRIIEEYRPDHIFSFNSLHSYYRVAYEAARHAGIPVLVHERGLVDDTFLMLADSTANHYEPRWSAWEHWKDVPLDAKACGEVAEYFANRELGKGGNFHPFYDFSSEASEVRRQLRIPAHGRIVAIFASTEREIGSIKGLIRRTFETQVEWLRRLTALLSEKDLYVVIRHHPNNTTKGVVDRDFLRVMDELNLEYGERVRVAMPYERITSYAIMRTAEAVFTYYSLTEAEATLRGIPAVCVAESVYIPMGVEFLREENELPSVIDRALARSGRMGIEDLRKAYRYSHFLFFKLNFRFRSVGIKNVYEPDIRVRSFEELRAGIDPALDQVCRHVLEGAPLYRRPTEDEKGLSDRDETAFLQRQLEENLRKRVPPGAVGATPVEEQLITLIRPAVGRETGATRMERTLRRSRHKRLERVPISLRKGAGAQGLLSSLREALNAARGEIVYVAPDNVGLDESMLSASSDILADDADGEVQAVAWGAWLLDSGGKVGEEFLTARIETPDFAAALKLHPGLKDPLQLLAFFVMRRGFLRTVCEYMEAFSLGSPEEFSSLFYESFYAKKGLAGIHKAGQPMLMIAPPEAAPETASVRAAPAEEFPMDQDKAKAALNAYADALERDPYHRESIVGSARILQGLGEGQAALSMLSHYLKRYSADGEIRELMDTWSGKSAAPGATTGIAHEGSSRFAAPSPQAVALAAAPAAVVPSTALRVSDGWSAAPSNPFAGEKIYASYAEAKPLVETVSGWLLDGQEKFLFDKAKAVPEGGYILEMGADRGRSTCAMGLACSGSDKRILSIDTFCGNDGIMGKTYDFHHEWLGNLRRLGVDRHCEGIKGFTYDILPKWAGRPMLDFVFIDASHEYIDVLQDFRQIYPYVKPGGWIAFHDVEPSWPGPWRVWLEHAVPLLADHEVVATLACGRKLAGREFDSLPKRAGFSFAAHWVEDLARAYGEGSPLFPALRGSLAFASAQEPQRRAILEQERIIGRMPEPLPTTLRNMLSKDANMDGHLHLWNGLVLMAQGKSDEAADEFRESLRVSYPVHPEHAAHYLARAGGAGARTAFSRPVEAAPAAIASRDGSHYGKDYFDWQKRIGAFGGVANLFKFREFVGDADTVVDFGSGGGFLLRNLPGKVKLGIEINETARKEASIKGGIDAVADAAELPDGFADVIVSNHALEHVESPLGILRMLARKLKPGGRMVCVVPHDGPQMGYDPSDVNKHLYTWNPMTLGNLFAAAGFLIDSCENIRHQWPPDFTEVYGKYGEEEFHRICREEAIRNGNYQVRVVARVGESRNRPVASAPEPLVEARAALSPSIHRPLIPLDDIPVALVVYKRHEHTSRVLRALKERGVRNIHIFCDGPKSEADAETVERTRALCRNLDWARPVVHESGTNRGLAKSIMEAADGLLRDHETLILLEDDCVPQRYFFDFMRKALTRYRDAEEVYGVSGYTVNVPDSILARYPHDVYFLPRIASWGWGTWKRAWAKLDRDLAHAAREAVARGINLAQCGSDIPHSLDSVLQGRTKDVWTLNWLLTVYLNRGYFAYPTVSHIDNIGMDGSGVHCGVTDKYVTRLADREPTRFPDRVGLDSDLIANYRKYYDL